jgi:SAM-dependent methyltransferase
MNTSQNPNPNEWINDVDDLPIPPFELINLVVGPSNPRDFVKLGKEIAFQSIVTALTKNKFALNQFHALLDFGCGCGRLTRHFKPLSNTKIYGTDYNPILIQWCQENLPFAEFQVNQLDPPLNYPEDTFDFIFAGSVFTHFTEEIQFAWLDELWRVLIPNGYLMITTHGEPYAKDWLTPELYEKFKTGEFIVFKAEEVGGNPCVAYHPPQYIQSKLTRKFSLIDHIPQGWDKQDVILLQKRIWNLKYLTNEIANGRLAQVLKYNFRHR